MSDKANKQERSTPTQHKKGTENPIRKQINIIENNPGNTNQSIQTPTQDIFKIHWKHLVKRKCVSDRTVIIKSKYAYFNSNNLLAAIS